MKLKPIITSLLETDAYKFNMMNVIFHTFNKDVTKWAFKCRNKNVRFTPEMVQEIREQIDFFCSLRFSKEELEWLAANFPWLKKDFINQLKRWYPDRNDIRINEGDVEYLDECGLAIEANGTWLDTTLYEIAILAIVNEVYFAFSENPMTLDEFKRRTVERLDNLITGVKPIGTFSEFGLRRRYSKETQDWLVSFLKDNVPGFVGTSNVYLAKKYGVKAIGTQAHEFFMALESHFEWNPAYINRFAMEAWVNEYQTLLGIALTDTIGTDVFLRDFNLSFATQFNGVRHDSGDPIEWGEKMIAHYKKLGIDPKTKTLLFSDSLDVDRANKLYEYFKDRTKVAFGIGTFLTNPSDNPLNIVFKMIECNGSPVAKLSNDNGKVMCRDDEFINHLRNTIAWRMEHTA